MKHFTTSADVPNINLEILVLNFSKVKTSSGFYTTSNSSIESLASLTLKWPFSLNRQRCTSRWRTSVNLAYLVELRGYKDGNKLIDLRTISLLQEKKALLMYSSAWASILSWRYNRQKRHKQVTNAVLVQEYKTIGSIYWRGVGGTQWLCILIWTKLY